MGLNDHAVAISTWVDGALPTQDPTSRLWARTAKVAEESGEVIAALVDYVGANPRRGGTREAIVKELCDVAFAALAAIAHMHGNVDVDVVEILTDHAAKVVDRAGLNRGAE